MKKEYIESFLTKNGGYTRKTLASFGVSGPPQKGWKKKLIAEPELPGAPAQQTSWL